MITVHVLQMHTPENNTKMYKILQHNTTEILQQYYRNDINTADTLHKILPQ